MKYLFFAVVVSLCIQAMHAGVCDKCKPEMNACLPQLFQQTRCTNNLYNDVKNQVGAAQLTSLSIDTINADIAKLISDFIRVKFTGDLEIRRCLIDEYADNIAAKSKVLIGLYNQALNIFANLAIITTIFNNHELTPFTGPGTKDCINNLNLIRAAIYKFVEWTTKENAIIETFLKSNIGEIVNLNQQAEDFRRTQKVKGGLPELQSAIATFFPKAEVRFDAIRGNLARVNTMCDEYKSKANELAAFIAEIREPY